MAIPSRPTTTNRILHRSRAAFTTIERVGSHKTFFVPACFIKPRDVGLLITTSIQVWDGQGRSRKHRPRLFVANSLTCARIRTVSNLLRRSRKHGLPPKVPSNNKRALRRRSSCDGG